MGTRKKSRKAEVTEDVCFYNVRVGRGDFRLNLEVKAILNYYKPFVFGLCETTGYEMREFPGYQLVRSRKTEGRANVAAYVRDDYPVSNVRWVEHEETWSKTNPGSHGQHEPRATLFFDAGQIPCAVFHAGPKRTDNTEAVQEEGFDILAEGIAPWIGSAWGRWTTKARLRVALRPRLIIGDANSRANVDDLSIATVKKVIGGGEIVEPRKIDTGLAVHMRVSRVRTVQSAKSVALNTDHTGMLFFRVTFDAKYAGERKGFSKWLHDRRSKSREAKAADARAADLDQGTTP